MNDFLFSTQKSAPSLGSPRRRLAGASSWSWRHWRLAWTSSPPETSCPAFAQTWACPSRCRWRPPSSPGRPWSWTWCPGGAPSQWLQQPSTWPPRPPQRRRPRKVRDTSVWIVVIAWEHKCSFFRQLQLVKHTLAAEVFDLEHHARVSFPKRDLWTCLTRSKVQSAEKTPAAARSQLTNTSLPSRHCSPWDLPSFGPGLGHKTSEWPIALFYIPEFSHSLKTSRVQIVNVKPDLWPLSAEIGDIAGVADVTIRQSYRLIYPRAAELFPPDFKFDTPVDKLPQLWNRCPQHGDHIFLLFLQDCIHSFFNSYFCWISLAPPKTSHFCRGARRNKMDTFQ